MLANSLERHTAGKHRPEVVVAVRESMAMALQTAAGQQVDNVELLFAAAGNYGDGSLAGDLEDAYPRWQSYSSMALASLPDGEGVPVLTQLAVENPENRQSKGSPLQMLVQASREHPEAGVALVGLAGTEEFISADWKMIASTLGGEEYRFRSEFFEGHGGGKLRLGKPAQIYTGPYLQAPYSWTDAEIEQRIQLIDKLSEIAPLNSANQLQKSRSRLLEWQKIDLIDGRRRKR